MLNNLRSEKRLLIEADLKPVQGERFQPTGFADLGAATYSLADGTPMLLVESTQSIANRLEATIIGSDNALISEMQGLSYIRVQMSGDSTVETNSLFEAHRINSPFIISDKDFQEQFMKDADYAKGQLIDWRKVAKAFFKYDVNSLLHGVFLANLLDGRVRLSRAVSGFIEARNIREVVAGGVKNNAIDPTGKLRAKNHSKDVYGNVPYTRMEYTAGSITAYFNLDLGLLMSYGLGDNAFDLLVGLALFKIRRFLNGGLRLRTACDFMVKDLRITSPEDFKLPEENMLLEFVQEKIQSVQDLFAHPPVTEIETEVTWPKGTGAQE